MALRHIMAVGGIFHGSLRNEFTFYTDVNLFSDRQHQHPQFELRITDRRSSSTYSKYYVNIQEHDHSYP